VNTFRNPLKERLIRGEIAVGVSVRQSRSVEIAKIAKTCGFDWLFIDLEHAALSIDTATQMCVAALDAGIAPLVRVPAGQFWMATRVLDGGALGIIMPHIDTPEQGREVVAHVKYPPLGRRSVAAPMPQTDFKPVPIGELTAMINAETLTIVMLETQMGIANADAIAAIPGIDVLLIGTNDLAADMGIPGIFGDSRIAASYEAVIGACRKHGKWPAMGGLYAEDLLRHFVGLGMRMIQAGSDLGFLMQAATQRADFVKRLLDDPARIR
jgi:2-keto-3-deoxy-L-rhamnonate aldolase RhmA